MSRKRPADWDLPGNDSPSSKRQPLVPKPTPSLPRKKYPKHKDSKVGEDFHSVPYPLTLLPKVSWRAFNRAEAGGVCSSCGKARVASVHQQKLFLVAERLSWEQGTVSCWDRSQNEEALWMCNAELGIFEPAVEDEEVVIGGRRSRDDALYPYKREEEVEFAMRLIATAELLNEASWTVWKGMVERMLKMLEKRQADDDVPLDDIRRSSPRRSPRKNGKQAENVLPTPPSSNLDQLAATSTKEPPIRSFDSLQDFYSLLDKIERTSPMGARLLEAYADRLYNETCGSCWFAGIPVASDDEDEPTLPPRSSSRPVYGRSIAPAQVPHDLGQYGIPRTVMRSTSHRVESRLPGGMRTPTRPSRQGIYTSPSQRYDA